MKKLLSFLLLFFLLCLLCACGKGQAPGPVSAAQTAVNLESSAAETDASDTKTPLSSLKDSIRLEGFSSVLPVTWLPDGLSPAAVIYGAAAAEENTLFLAGVTGETAESKTILYKIDAETGSLTARLEIDSSFGQFYGGQIFNVFPKPYGYLVTLSEGFQAVDFDLAPIRQVLFSDLPGFDYLWFSDGENFTDRYDVSDDFRYLASLGQTYSVIDLEEVRPLVTRRNFVEWAIDLGDDGRTQPSLALAGDKLVGVGMRWFANAPADKRRQGLYTYSIAEDRKVFTPLSVLEGMPSFRAYPVLDGGQTAEFRWDGSQADDRLLYRFSWPDMTLEKITITPPEGFSRDYYPELSPLQTRRFCLLSLEGKGDPESLPVNALVLMDLETKNMRAAVYPANMRLEPVSVSPEGAVLVKALDLSDPNGASGVYILR